MLIEKLYRGEEIPEGTKRLKVAQLHNHIFERLKEEMEKKHVWLAVCTAAVDVGMRKVMRFRKRRRKLLGMLNKCRVYLGVQEIVLPDNWEEEGIYDGYGAVSKWREETGGSLHLALATAAVLEGDLPRAAVALEMEFEDIIKS